MPLQKPPPARTLPRPADAGRAPATRPAAAARARAARLPRALDGRTAVIRLFDAYAALLTDRQRALVRMYYHDDLSLGEIGARIGVTPRPCSTASAGPSARCAPWKSSSACWRRGTVRLGRGSRRARGSRTWSVRRRGWPTRCGRTWARSCGPSGRFEKPCDARPALLLPAPRDAAPAAHDPLQRSRPGVPVRDGRRRLLARRGRPRDAAAVGRRPPPGRRADPRPRLWLRRRRDRDGGPGAARARGSRGRERARGPARGGEHPPQRDRERGGARGRWVPAGGRRAVRPDPAQPPDPGRARGRAAPAPRVVGMPAPGRPAVSRRADEPGGPHARARARADLRGGAGGRAGGRLPGVRGAPRRGAAGRGGPPCLSSCRPAWARSSRACAGAGPSPRRTWTWRSGRSG